MLNGDPNRMALERGDRSIYLGPGSSPGKAALHYYGGMANGSNLVDLNGIDIAELVDLVNLLPGVKATYTPPGPELPRRVGTVIRAGKYLWFLTEHGWRSDADLNARYPRPQFLDWMRGVLGKVEFEVLFTPEAKP